MNYNEDTDQMIIMPDDEDRFFGTENINSIFGEWKIKYISFYIISCTSTANTKWYWKLKWKYHSSTRSVFSRQFHTNIKPRIKLNILT